MYATGWSGKINYIMEHATQRRKCLLQEDNQSNKEPSSTESGFMKLNYTHKRWKAYRTNVKMLRNV